MAAYFSTLDPMALVRALPGNVAQGLIWGIMALGVYITFRILDFADLTVDGTLATGGAVAVVLIKGGMHPAMALISLFWLEWQVAWQPDFYIRCLESPGFSPVS